MSLRKHSATLLVLVGEQSSGKSRLAHLLIGDVNDEKRKAKSEEKENSGEDNKDPNDNVVTKATVVVNDGKEQQSGSPTKTSVLVVSNSRMGAAGGRGYRIAEAPDVDKIASNKTEVETLRSLVAELEATGQLNLIVLTLRSTDSKLRPHHVDFLNVLRSVYGLDVLKNVAVVFTDWPLDSASIENRRKAGVSQDQATQYVSEQLNKLFGTSIKHNSFVMDAFEKLPSQPVAGGDNEVNKKILGRDQELRRLLLEASHADPALPRTHEQFQAEHKLLQEILDNSLGAWYEAKDYLVDDLLRVCEISKDAFLTRTRRGLRSKIDVCDQIIDRDSSTEHLKMQTFSDSQVVASIEERLSVFAKLEEAIRRQINLSSRWTQIKTSVSDMYAHIDARQSVEGLSSSQRESMLQTLNLVKEQLEDLIDGASKYCLAHVNNVTTNVGTR